MSESVISISNEGSVRRPSSVIGGLISTSYSYADLCREHFRCGSSGERFQYSKKDPKQPLLKHTLDEDKEIILKVWRAILRFMNESKEIVQQPRPIRRTDEEPMLVRLREELNLTTDRKNLKSTTSNNQTAVENKDLTPNKASQSSGRRRWQQLTGSLSDRLSRNSHEPTRLPIEETLVDPLGLIQFITGCGILKPKIRDEIYCMVFRQLTNNTSKNGRICGWNLLHLLIGIFLPSEKILLYLAKFIDDGPSANIPPLKKLLLRAIRNGPRFQPTSATELFAIQNKMPIDLQVTLMDGTCRSIHADSHVTSEEIIQNVSKEIEMKQTFGFSVFISMGNKVTSLGGGRDKIFDSISTCEQLHRSGSLGHERSQWRLFVRKEMFSPWDDITTDLVATNLVFSQISRGLILGEYDCDTDRELAALAARQYYIEYGCDVSEKGIYPLLSSYIPAKKLNGEDAKGKWSREIVKYHRKLFTSDIAEMPSASSIKIEMTFLAKSKWQNLFSRFYAVIRLAGPRWATNHVTIAVNHVGLSVMTSKATSVLTLEFHKISSVIGDSCENEKKSDVGNTITFLTIDGTLLKFQTHDASDLFELVNYCMKGLRERSIWAVAKMDSQQEDPDTGESLVAVVEGDLIQLLKPAQQEAMTSSFCECLNMTTKQRGKIRSKQLYIIPTQEEPHEDTIRLLTSSKHYYAKRTANVVDADQQTRLLGRGEAIPICHPIKDESSDLNASAC